MHSSQYMSSNSSSSSFFVRFLNRFLITCLITIICLILFKKNSSFKAYFNDKVLSVNFNFASINSIYKKYFGSPLPFSSIIPKTEPVFNERLSYTAVNDYLDGVSLSVSDNYLVPSISDGLVVFIGEKEGYGNTVIVEGSDGVDTWYSNMSDVSVSLYQYISNGSFIGNCSKNLYLVFKKDGNVIDYLFIYGSYL